jgi:hypothetical protein
MVSSSLNPSGRKVGKSCRKMATMASGISWDPNISWDPHHDPGPNYNGSTFTLHPNGSYQGSSQDDQRSSQEDYLVEDPHEVETIQMANFRARSKVALENNHNSQY